MMHTSAMLTVIVSDEISLIEQDGVWDYVHGHNLIRNVNMEFRQNLIIKIF